MNIFAFFFFNIYSLEAFLQKRTELMEMKIHRREINIAKSIRPLEYKFLLLIPAGLDKCWWLYLIMALPAAESSIYEGWGHRVEGR